MARKNSGKQGKDFFDGRNGRVIADLNFAHHRTSSNPKSQIAFIREAVPLRSKDDITLVLQSCDYDVAAAIACFTNGEADNLLKEWRTQGKKSKNGNSAKKKQNKKKQAKQSEPDAAKDDHLEKDSENTVQPIQNGHEEDTIKSEEDTKKPTPIASMTLECPSSTNLLHPPSPSSSEISLPSSNSDTPTESTQDPESAPNQSSGSPGIPNVTSAPVKFERTMSTGPDALKKTVKDLHRSSVSLPRFQLLLEEECENSFKSIVETFKELRQSLNDREAQLLAQMEGFKKQAVELLEQRQENAAALKLKSVRVGGMSETQVTQLRNEIKNFVTERKIDEELAKTTRFVGEKDEILSMINNFGRVMPIKSCYSPVTLNPPPLPVKKEEENKASKERTDAVKPVIPATTPTTTAAIPTISLQTEEKSTSSPNALQEVAELHARLQEALRQQGLSSSKSSEGQKSRSDNRKGRPNSAPHTSPQNHAPSPRPHTTHPPSQHPRKSQNPQHKEFRGSEARGPQQDGKDRNQSNRNPRKDGKDSNQSNRNPRRGNQRRQPHSRDNRPGSSNERKETPNEAERSSQISEETTQLEKEKHSQSGNEEVQSQKSDSTNKEHAQAHQARERRDHGEDRPRNRNRRRGGRRGAEGGQNERGPSRGVTDKGKNGPLEKDLSEKGPKEKLNLAIIEGKEAEGTEVGSDSPAAKNSESSSGVSKLQDFSVVNGKETDTGRTNSSECVNGEKAHEGDTSVKEALPQRPDRGSRRRGAQRDRKDGPHPRQTQNKSLNGTKTVENGMDHSSAAENSNIQNGSEESKESPKNEKLPIAGKETKINGQTLQDHDKDFDKSYVPKVNGYIPVKEVNEVSIDR